MLDVNTPSITHVYALKRYFIIGGEIFDVDKIHIVLLRELSFCFFAEKRNLRIRVFSYRFAPKFSIYFYLSYRGFLIYTNFPFAFLFSHVLKEYNGSDSRCNFMARNRVQSMHRCFRVYQAISYIR